MQKRALVLLLSLAVAVGSLTAAAGSGLDVGDKITAFLVKNCEKDDVYCQVCQYGKRPKLITVGDLDDPAWIADLKAIQTFHDKYAKDGKGLGVFAVAASIRDGRAHPVGDPVAALEKLRSIKKEHGLTFPLVIAQPPKESGSGYAVFEDYYKITQSRTVIFGDPSNTVKFNAVLADGTRDNQLSALDRTVQKFL
jgi:hypothetical protein